MVVSAPAHGRPNWTDLHTARAGEARVFYEHLLGWEFHHKPMLAAVPDLAGPDPAGPDPAGPDLNGPSPKPSNGMEPDRTLEKSSSLATVDGEPVAEIVSRGELFEARDPLSNWFPYVQVDDLDATLDLVEPAGGLVLCPPASRADDANVATILDPSDALLRIWQPAPTGKRPRRYKPGALTWIELETNDLDKARKFYGELFGWDAGEVSDPSADDPYIIFSCGGDPVAGAVWTPLEELPASWCTAFAVADTDAAVARAADIGGVVMTEPTEMAIGRQSVLVDPTGAVFALLGPPARGPRPL